MFIAKELSGASLTLKLEGRLDVVTAPLLEAELNRSLTGVTDLTFDFDKLEYLTSAGFRVLIIAYKKMLGQGSLKVINANELVREAFEVTHVSDIISIV
jgi:anti-sigma B factor antagonist